LLHRPAGAGVRIGLFLWAQQELFILGCAPALSDNALLHDEAGARQEKQKRRLSLRTAMKLSQNHVAIAIFVVFTVLMLLIMHPSWLGR